MIASSSFVASSTACLSSSVFSHASRSRSESFLLKCKLVCGLAALALVVGSAVTFKVVTGRCPVGAVCQYFHGDAKTPDATSN